MTPPVCPGFLRSGGELSAEILAIDWAATSLGPLETWPQVIKSTLATWLDAPQAMFMVWGPDLRSFFNAAYRPLLGARGAGALGRPFRELWCDIWPSIEPLLLKALEGQGSHFEDMPLTMARNGVAELTWWTFTYMPLRDESGAVLGMLCVMVETTEKVLADHRAAAERDRQFDLLQQMPGFVVVLRGPIHVYEYANDAYQRVFGPRKSLGLPVREVFPELIDQGYFELLDRVYTTGVPFVAHAMPIRLAGETDVRYIEFRYEAIRDPRQEVTGIFVSGHEVTETVRAERQLRLWNETLEQRVTERTAELLRAQDALRHAQKLETVGRLTGGLAHDINNLLSVMGNSVALLQRRDLPAPQRRRGLECIEDAVMRGAELTNQLLAFARRQPLMPIEFDVGRQVQTVTRLLAPLVGPLVDIDVRLPGRPAWAQADVNQFEATLMNLAVNARDAMDGEGRLIVQIGEVETLPGHDGTPERPGPYVAVSMTDTGCGIAPEHREAVFEPFFTTKPEGKGTGLGLSQAIGFAQQSGGDLQLRSMPGQGATFTLYLPSVAAHDAVLAPGREKAGMA